MTSKSSTPKTMHFSKLTSKSSTSKTSSFSQIDSNRSSSSKKSEFSNLIIFSSTTSTTSSSSSSSLKRGEFLQTLSSSTQSTNFSTRLTGGDDSNRSKYRLDSVLQYMGKRISSLYKELFELQKRRDFLLLSINIIKSKNQLTALTPADRADVITYIKMLENQMGSVELFASHSKRPDSLVRISKLIDAMLVIGNLTMSMNRCVQYLKACLSFEDICPVAKAHSVRERSRDIFADSSDASTEKPNSALQWQRREFEALLTGCTLQDRKDVYERLLAIEEHLNFQISYTTAS